MDTALRAEMPAYAHNRFVIAAKAGTQDCTRGDDESRHGDDVP